MTKSDTQNLSEKQAGARGELVFSEGEAQFCSQVLGIWVVKPVAWIMRTLVRIQAKQHGSAVLNKMGSYSRQIAVLLVFLPFFATVAPATVLGEDTVFVQNIAVTSTHTGGQGVDGADGKDGADGRDGQDGMPGQDGETVVSGVDRSTAEVFTTTNGIVTDVQMDVAGTGEVYTNVVPTTEPAPRDEQVTATAEPEVAQEPEPSDEQRSGLLELLSTLQKLIEHYVNALF